MLQLSLQLEIDMSEYIFDWLNTWYIRTRVLPCLRKNRIKYILPAVARKCFYFWGSSETHMMHTTRFRFVSAEITYFSRVNVYILCTIIGDQLKSNLDVKKKLSDFHDLLKYSGSVVKIRFLPVRVVVKDLKLLIPIYMHIHVCFVTV